MKAITNINTQVKELGYKLESRGDEDVSRCSLPLGESSHHWEVWVTA
jgi:hypothetical protein